MPNAIESVLISSVVALLTAAIGGYVSWQRLQREKTKWLAELKSAYSVELYRARLEAYPRIMEIFGRLSSHAAIPLTPETSRKAGAEINAWLYSEGGLLAEASTRGALFGLRHACQAWKEGPRPGEISRWRNVALLLLRRDLDIHGLESFDPHDRGPLLERLEREISSFK